MNTVAKSLFAAAALAAAAQFAIAQSSERWTGEARDAWITGKIDASLMVNSELDNFHIMAEVNDGRAVLSGEVGSETEKMLAGDIVSNIEGVTAVDNRLSVNPQLAGQTPVAGEQGERSFGTIVQDLTTTARLKTRFALNRELDASEIEIDTVDGEVRLYGDVDSQAKKDLAEQMAHQYEHVTSVRNELRVMPSRTVGSREN